MLHLSVRRRTRSDMFTGWWWVEDAILRRSPCVKAEGARARKGPRSGNRGYLLGGKLGSWGAASSDPSLPWVF